jgi:hypothetical protein
MATKNVRSTAFGCPNERERMFLTCLLEFFNFNIDQIVFHMVYRHCLHPFLCLGSFQ